MVGFVCDSWALVNIIVVCIMLPSVLWHSWFGVSICLLEYLNELSSCWDGRPFGHNRHGPKSGGLLCPFPWGELGCYLTQCGLGQGLPPYQVASWSIQSFGHNTPTLQTDRQTGQWSRSIGIGWTVTCNDHPKTICPDFMKFSVCYLWLWLGLPLVIMPCVMCFWFCGWHCIFT